MADSPYEPPEEDSATDPGADKPSIDAYAGLNTALGIFGLVGVCMGCFGVVTSLVASDALGGASAMMTTEQATAYADLMAANNRLMPLSVISLLVALATSCILTLGGIGALRKTASGMGTLRIGVVVAMIGDPIRVLLLLVTQLLIREENAAYMKASMGGPGLPPEFQEMMPVIAAITIALTVAFSVFWLAVKMLLYFLTLRRLNRIRGY